MSKKICACCKAGTDAMQCGWPMHKFCYKKSNMVGKHLGSFRFYIVIYRDVLESVTTSTLSLAKDSPVTATRTSNYKHSIL